MHRCSSGFLLTLAIAFVVAFTGCLGKSSSNAANGGVESVTLSPGGVMSINVGDTRVFTAVGKDGNGHAVLGTNIQFIVANGSPNGSAPLSVINNGAGSGSACAGTWDSTAAICASGNSGIAIVTAVVNGVSSPPTTVYVHQHIDSIQITQAQTQPPQYDCFSQGQTWLFQGVAYSQGVDITNTVGPMSWSSVNAGVVSATPYVPPNQPAVLNQVQTTALSPGITQLFATVSGTSSGAYPYTTCLIKAIYLQIGGQGQAGNSIAVNNGASVSVTATAVDTLYGIANTTALASPPLTWSTTNPEVAAFSTTTNSTGSNNAATRNNLGGATLTASCTPPTCNIGVLPGLPIYASDCLPTSNPPCQLPNGTKGYGAISVDVTSTSAVPTYNAVAATTDCNDQSACSSALFLVTPGITPIVAIVNLPRTPNSMVFNHQSMARVYVGSDQGLMYLDVAGSGTTATLVSGSSTPCSVALCGKVLTVSNDGKMVVVSDDISTPSDVYIYNSAGNAPVDLIIPGEIATAAAFSPDQLKIFILTNLGNMYISSTVDAPTSVSTSAPGTDVKFSADGSFAYVAGSPTPTSISGFATCDDQPTHHDPATATYDFVTTLGIPLQIFPSPDGQHVFVLDPANGSIDVFATTEERKSLPDGQFLCNAQPPFVDLDPTVNFPQTAQSFDLGQGKNFVPVYAQLVNDGAEVIVVARHLPAVLVFDVSNGTTSSVALVGNTDPLSASASTDGSQVYIAACDAYPNNDPSQPCAAGSVHIVNTCGVLSCNTPPNVGQGDFQQVPYVNINNDNNPNMCSSQGGSASLCLPNLIAIRPQ